MSKYEVPDDVPAPVRRELLKIIKTLDAQASVVEQALNESRAGLFRVEQTVNLFMNTINAVLVALYKGGVVTKEGLIEAGRQLYSDYKENERRLNGAVMAKKLGISVEPPELIKNPLQEIISLANIGAAQKSHDEKKKEPS